MIKARKKLWLPSGLCYTSAKGGVLELIIGLKRQNLDIIYNFFNNTITANQFLEKDYNADILVEAYTRCFDLDLQTVAGRVETKVGENISLGAGINNVLNDCVKEDFEAFIENIMRDVTTSGKKAAKDLNKAVREATRVREHTNALRKHVPEGTRARILFDKSERNMLNSVRNAYEAVEFLEGKVDLAVKQKFFASEPTISLEAAFEYATSQRNFAKLTRRPLPVISPKPNVRNYPK